MKQIIPFRKFGRIGIGPRQEWRQELEPDGTCWWYFGGGIWTRRDCWVRAVWDWRRWVVGIEWGMQYEIRADAVILWLGPLKAGLFVTRR